MRRPKHEPATRLLRVQDVQRQVEFERNRSGHNTMPAQFSKSTMQTKESMIIMKKSPSSAFHLSQLHTCKKLALNRRTLLLTLSVALVLFSLAFATRFTTISAAATTASRHHHHNHDHKHHQHKQIVDNFDESILRNSGNRKRPRHVEYEKSINGGLELESSRHKSWPHHIQHMQEQQRLRNLIAKTSSTLRLPGVNHHKRTTRAHDESPLQQQQQQKLAESAAVQNLHRQRRYRFYDNEIKYPKASRHFIHGAPKLYARLKTLPDQNLHGFSMHDDFKFWNDLEHDQYGDDEFDDVDSLDVDLDDDEDDENYEDDLDEDEDAEADEVHNQLDGDEESATASSAKYPRRLFETHQDGRHRKTTRYFAKHPGHRNQESSQAISRANRDHSGLHARDQELLSDYDRYHMHGQPLTEQHRSRVSKVPYQSPVVVSISDNSFVSASPPVLVGSGTSREQHQPQQNRNAIDAMVVTDDEPDGDRPTTMNNSKTSTTATTTSIHDDSLERDHVISSSGIGSLFNITGYNRVETSTRRNLFSSDHDDGVSRNRKVHLLKPPAGGDTFNYHIDNSIIYSSRTATPPPPSMEDKVGVYTPHADQINHQKKDESQSYLVANTYVPSPQVVDDHATYGYDSEPTATITSTNLPQSTEVAYKFLNNKIVENDESMSTKDDNIDNNVDGQDNDDDGDDKDDDDDDDIDLDQDEDNNLTIDSVKIHPKSMENNHPPVRYSHIIASPKHELPLYGPKYWHTPHHKATIQLLQEKPTGLRRGSITSAIIAILFGIGATGMLIMIVSIKMGSIRERVAYKGRRRSLVPDTDFLINTIPI